MMTPMVYRLSTMIPWVAAVQLVAAATAVTAYGSANAPPDKPYHEISADTIEFSAQRPCIFYSAKDIERIKELLKDSETYQHEEYEIQRARANRWVDKEIEVGPNGSGGEYAKGRFCGKCGANLPNAEHKRLADGSWTHVCPKCKVSYTGEPYDGYWRGRRHYMTGHSLPWLGLTYALSNDERYARKAREILLAFARYYPDWSCPVDSPLHESYWLVMLAWGYDLVYESPCFSADDHERIADRLMRMGANRFRTRAGRDGRGTNREAYYNAAVAAIAFCIRDRDLAAFAANRFNSLVANGADEDGFWFEGLGYHTMTLDALMKTAEAAYRSGVDLYQNPSFLRMLKAPILLAFPDGRIDGERRLWDRTGVHCEIAYLRCHDPDLILAIPPAKMAYGTPLWVTPEWRSQEQRRIALPSRDLASFGYAVLRSGEGKDQVYLSMTHGEQAVYMGHAPSLKFGVVLYANGRLRTPLGAGGRYADPLCGSWYRRPIAHNTITVDQFPQTPSKATVVAFQDAPAVKLVKAVDTGAYAGVTLTRILALVNGIPVDVSSAASDQVHRYDLSCRFFGKLTPNLPLADRPGPLGCLAGYEHVDGLQEGRTRATWSADWRQEDGVALRLTVLGGEDTGVIAGHGPGMTSSAEQIPLIVARRWGKATTFLSVMESCTKDSAIQRIDPLSPGTQGQTDPADTTGLRMESQRSVDYLLVSRRPAPTQFGSILFDGEIAVVSYRRDEEAPRVLDLVNGKRLGVAGYSLRSDEPATLYLERAGTDACLLIVGEKTGGTIRIEGAFGAGAQVTSEGKVVATGKGSRTLSLPVERNRRYRIAGVAGPVQVAFAPTHKAARTRPSGSAEPQSGAGDKHRAAKQQVTCARASSPPTIDGEIELDEWAEAQQLRIEHTDTGSPNQAVAMTLWDDQNFYLAIGVKDQDVVSNAKSRPRRPSNVYEGDDVEFYLDTLNLRAERMGPGCYHLLIGAGGAYAGDAAEASTYAVRVQGTLNNSEDVDHGYTVEVAVLWSTVGGLPTPMTNVMSFNATVLDYDATTVDQPGKCSCLSWAKTSNRPARRATTHSPAHWNQIVFEPIGSLKPVDISMKPISGRNRVRNSGFEINGREYQAPEPWQFCTSAHWVGFRPEYTYSDARAATGKYSLCLKAQKWYGHVTGDAWLEQREIVARPGADPYTLSLSVRASRTTKVRLALYGFDPRWGRDFAGGVSPLFDVDTAWKRISITRSFGPHIAWIGAIIKRETQFHGGDLYIDDVQLERGAGAKTFAIDQWTQLVRGKASKPVRPNLIVNSGFEDGLRDWRPGGVMKAECISVDASEKYGGQRSLRIRHQEVASTWASSTRISLRRGARYLLSGWIKMEQVQPGFHYPGARLWVCGDDNYFGGELQTGTQGWRQIERAFIAKSDGPVQIRADLRNSTGIVWFDDLSLTLIEDKP